ncbi:MAG: hypothetical protein JXA28_04485, partial [Bacteroidetes bacterium]|nr:hypothetical protein [Bacteroidota bacterium]
MPPLRTIFSRLLLSALPFLPLHGCEAQSESALRRYDLEKRFHRVDLSGRLREISGLAVNADGQLFAHDDERGVVYRLDPMTGSVLSSFLLGRTMVTEDFEGIAVSKHRMYMVTSSGTVYEFREAGEGKRVEYRTHRTPLNRTNDVEGLCYDPEKNTLLLACKGDAGKGRKGRRAVYDFSLKTKKLLSEPR